jgi:hypothetical protein
VIAVERLLKSAQKSFLEGYTEISKRVSADIGQILITEANTEGIVPLRRIPAVQQQAQDILYPVFVDSSDRPYAEDNRTPTAEYSQLVNRHVVSVVVGVAYAHQRWLEQNTPADVFTWLSGRPSGYRAGGPFRSNPLAEYDPFHLWVDPRGYNLSQRIWNIDNTGVGQRTLADLNAYLDWNIRRGTSALRMAQDLQTFMRPGARLKMTNRPYGTTTSYHGMVLARSEIARAHSETVFLSSLANPYVNGIEWKLSVAHPKVDICDQLATIGMSGERLKPAYPVDDAKQVVRDSHPQCLCTNFPATGEIADVTAQVRAVMADHDSPPFLTPARVIDFSVVMLGTQLLFEIQEALAA